MATKKSKIEQKNIIFAVVAIAVLAFVIIFSTSGQTAKFHAPQVPPRGVQPLAGSITVGLNVEESTTFNGKTITLKNVGSSPPSIGPIIVAVDGIVETVTGTETVNGITIKPEATLYWANDIKLRYAILTFS